MKTSILRRPPGAGSLRRAFSLIEILIVLAIIGVLAAILLPVFNNARESARIATCSSNLKQIGVALNQYVQDSGGFYPNVYGVVITPSNPTLNLGDCTWSARIYPYLKSTQVLECPSFTRGQFRTGCPAAEKANDGSIYFNSWDGSYDLAYGSSIRNSQGMTSAVRVKQPSNWILSFDGQGMERSFDWVLNDDDYQEFIDEGYARHRGGLNALFFDGHVKWLPFDAVLKPSYWK